MESKEEGVKGPQISTPGKDSSSPLPDINYERERIEAILKNISITKEIQAKILLYLDAIDKRIKEIENYKNAACPSDFYEAILSNILSVRNVSKEIQKLTYNYNEILSNKIQQLFESWIIPLEQELNKRLSMPLLEKDELEFKTKKLYAQQSYVVRSPIIQQSFMKHLSEISALLKKPGEPSPRCYISYAWPSLGNKDKEYWVQPFLYILCEHLKAAGIDIVMDVRDSRAGASIYGFMDQYNDGNYIIAIGTPSFRQKHLDTTAAAVQTELNIALKRNDEDKKLGRGGRIYPLLISGIIESSFPDGYRMYRNIQDGREGGEVSYIESIEKLVAWLHRNKLNNNQDLKLKKAYVNKWRAFYELYRSQGGLTNSANSVVIEQELQIGYHKQRLDYLRKDLTYQALEVQEKAEYSAATNTKIIGALIESSGINAQNLWDAAGRQYQRPTTNPNFVSRQTLQANIDVHFRGKEQEIFTLTVRGMGGMGKTGLASYYFQHPPQPYAIRAWFHADNREQIYQQYLDLIKQAEGIEYPKEMPIEEQVQRVKQWLERQKDCLLVFDNVEKAQDLDGLLPEQGKHHILITSRNAADLSLGSTVDVDVMTENEAIDLVVEIAGGKDKDAKLGYKEKNLDGLKDLVKTLGYLPLALAQAASYIRENPTMDIKGYLDIYSDTKHNNQEQLLKYQTEALDATKHEPVWINFDINFKALEKDCPNALTTLKQASWLAPDDIPEAILFKMLEASEVSGTEKLLLWSEILEKIAKHSLMRIKKEQRLLSIHPLVQDILRNKQTEEERLSIFKQASANIDFASTQLKDKKNILTHAECLYKHGQSFVAALAKQNDKKFQLLSTQPNCLGQLYLDLGLIDKALTYFNHKEQVYLSVYGAEHFETATTLVNLGVVMRQLGRFDDAKKYLEQSLRIQEKHYGTESIETATTLVNLGVVMQQLGNLKEAKEYLERALKIQEAYYKEEHPEMAITLGSLGSVFIDFGKLDEAKKYLEQSLRIQEMYYEPGHIATATTLVNLGNIFFQLDKFDIAKQYFQRALKIQETYHGQEYFATATTMVNVGNAFRELGELGRAKEYYKQALKIQETYYGKNHIEIVITLFNISLLCLKLNQKQRAKGYLLRAKEIYTKHPDKQEHLPLFLIDNLLLKIKIEHESSKSSGSGVYDLGLYEAAFEDAEESMADIEKIKDEKAHEFSTYRPSDWQHIHFAAQACQNRSHAITPDWSLIDDSNISERVFGGAYVNKNYKHIIIAHHGPEFDNKNSLDLDIKILNFIRQEEAAWHDFAKKIIEKYGPTYTYSFTGYSFGGWFAQSCLFKYENEFVGQKNSNYQDGFAVTLDEPGSKELLEGLQPMNENYKIDTEQLDITNYLSYPNILNTGMRHIGTVYTLFLEPNQLSTKLFTSVSFNVNRLLEQFSEESGLANKCARVLDWPRIAWRDKLSNSNESEMGSRHLWRVMKTYINGDIQKGEYNGFFKYTVDQMKNFEQLNFLSEFKLEKNIHYLVEDFNSQNLPLRNMPKNVRRFLFDLKEYKDRAEIIEIIIDKPIGPDIAVLLNTYSINVRDELVVDKLKTNISAREFIAKIRKFLSQNDKLYKNKIETLLAKNILTNIRDVKPQQIGMLSSLLDKIDIQIQHIYKLLNELKFTQGTTRLYKYVKPSLDELLQIKNQHEALGLELKYISDSKSRLNDSLIEATLKKDFSEKLDIYEQQLIIAKQITFSLWQYMEGNIEQADEVLDVLISSFNNKIKLPNLDANLLLNRVYNLKAKIAALKPGQINKELSIKYYNYAIMILPNDVITYSNFIGLLTDRARSENNPYLQLQAYNYYEKISLDQMPEEQTPMVCSSLAYSLIMLAKNIEQEKIADAKIKKLPSVISLHDKAQSLLKNSIHFNPNYLNARLHLAILFYEQQSYNQALQEIDIALVINSEHPIAQTYKGLILEKLNFKDEALEYLNMAKRNFEAQKNSIDNLGWIKEIDEAIEEAKLKSNKKLRLKH